MDEKNEHSALIPHSQSANDLQVEQVDSLRIKKKKQVEWSEIKQPKNKIAIKA